MSLPTEIINEQHDRLKQWVSRILRKDRLAHAYLFVGRSGSGKKELALYMTQALFCPSATAQTEFTPCRHCVECKRIEHGNHPDIHWLAPDGSSLKIEQIRELQREFSYRGVETQKKVYIIEHIDRMTTQAANSLLKFLEEPYSGTLALLLTEQKQRLLPTIISRCQELKFPPPSPKQLIHRLHETYPLPLASCAAHITADLEKASHLCEAEWFAEIRSLMIQLLQEETGFSLHQGFALIQDRWLPLTKERDQLDISLELLLLWYQDLLYSKVGLEDQFVYIDQTERLKKRAMYLSKEKIAEGIEHILGAKKRLHAHVNPQLLLEQLLIRLQEG
ncbi:DNA polymerase III subunit delta' [Bacillus horti]|nr:DNA polymerase III subunit delta' [Bacillus horti]